MKLKRRTAVSFDDILLIPQQSVLESRQEVETLSTVHFGPDFKIECEPIIASNMTSVYSRELTEIMHDNKCLTFLPRIHGPEWQLKELKYHFKNGTTRVLPSIGVRDPHLWIDFTKRFLKLKPELRAVVVDVAHWDCTPVWDFHDFLHREIKDKLFVIGGNVASYRSYRTCWSYGVSAVKVGIGGGSVCTTRLTTGHGVPTMQSLLDIANGLSKHRMDYNDDDYNPPWIIADGGIRNSGDIVKCLAVYPTAAICIGKLLATTFESGSEKVWKEGIRHCKHYGMSSKQGHQDINQASTQLVEEGTETLYPCTTSAHTLVPDLLNGIKAGLAYSGAYSISDFQRKAKAYRITDNASKESKFN